jgi:hypothetical protein
VVNAIRWSKLQASTCLKHDVFSSNKLVRHWPPQQLRLIFPPQWDFKQDLVSFDFPIRDVGTIFALTLFIEQQWMI